MQDREHLLHEEFESYAKGASTAIPGTNICSTYKLRKGDVEKGFAESDLVIEHTYRTPAVQHGYIEPHSSIAEYNRHSDRLTVWTSTVSPYNAQREISEIWSMPMSKIRVVVPTVGGSFGTPGNHDLGYRSLCGLWTNGLSSFWTRLSWAVPYPKQQSRRLHRLYK